MPRFNLVCCFLTFGFYFHSSLTFFACSARAEPASVPSVQRKLRANNIIYAPRTAPYTPHVSLSSSFYLVMCVLLLLESLRIWTRFRWNNRARTMQTETYGNVPLNKTVYSFARVNKRWVWIETGSRMGTRVCLHCSIIYNSVYWDAYCSSEHYKCLGTETDRERETIDKWTVIISLYTLCRLQWFWFN